MSDCFKVFITEEVYLACMSLTYTTNEIDYTAFIIGEKIIGGKDKQVVGLFLYLTEITMDKIMNQKTCDLTYEKVSKEVDILGALSNQPLRIVGWFHAHNNTHLSSDMSFLDSTIFEFLIRKDPAIFSLIASVSTDSTNIHSSTVKAYRSTKNKNVQLVNFVIVPSARKVFFDKIFSLAQIFHFLQRREEENIKNRTQNSGEDYFVQKLAAYKGFERYSCHIHRFVYPAFQTLIQDKEIIKSLENFYSTMESKLVKDEKNR